MKTPMRPLALILAFSSGLFAWSPRFHETQTMLAARLTPRGLQRFLLAHPAQLALGARGQSSDQVPTVEEVEAQFERIVILTEQRRQPERLVQELGSLAHQVQLLMDPSAIRGATPLRDAFESYGDEKRPRLALTREDCWAAKGPLEPRPALLRWALQKFERNQALAACFDEATGRRVGAWDDLSLPYAQLQLAYSNGVHATANLWILLWRAVGDQWQAQIDDPLTPNS